MYVHDYSVSRSSGGGGESVSVHYLEVMFSKHIVKRQFLASGMTISWEGL